MTENKKKVSSKEVDENDELIGKVTSKFQKGQSLQDFDDEDINPSYKKEEKEDVAPELVDLLDAPVSNEEFDWEAYERGENKESEKYKEQEKMYSDTLSSVAVDEVVMGTVVQMNSREAVVNIGYKSEGVVSLNEFRYNPDLKVGDQVEVYVESKEDIYFIAKNKSINATPSQIIITDGVVLKNKLERIFNTKINRDMTKYIIGGIGYQNDTKGKIWTKAMWKKTLRLRKDSSYIVFENYMNNFNKITGKIVMEYTISSDRETRCRLVVYDKEEYDKGNLDEYLYINDDFNYTGIVPFSFTFDRTTKNIVFVLYVDGKYKDRAVYFKDLKYGFSKSAYREEIIRKTEEKEEIEYLKSLGIYVEDEIYFDLIDEDGEILDEIEEEIDEIEKYFDYEKYYDDLLDKKSGPAFDEELKKLMRDVPFGPYIEVIGTLSEIKTKEKYKSRIVYTE